MSDRGESVRGNPHGSGAAHGPWTDCGIWGKSSFSITRYNESEFQVDHYLSLDLDLLLPLRVDTLSLSRLRDRGRLSAAPPVVAADAAASSGGMTRVL